MTTIGVDLLVVTVLAVMATATATVIALHRGVGSTMMTGEVTDRHQGGLWMTTLLHVAVMTIPTVCRAIILLSLT